MEVRGRVVLMPCSHTFLDLDKKKCYAKIALRSPGPSKAALSTMFVEYDAVSY